MGSRPENVLGADTRPRFFPVGNAEDLDLAPPEPQLATSVRTWARSLAGMQKEALVTASGGHAWRLVSDEGPYLDGYDEGPFPLSHMTTGMVASYMNEVLRWADHEGLRFGDLRLTLHNRYTMEGSALKGTMIGGALAPELEVAVDTDADTETVEQVVAQAVESSPVHGLMTAVRESRFTLSANGDRLAPDAVRELDGDRPPDPEDRFGKADVSDRQVPQPLIELVTPADEVEGEGGAGSSYAESQSRVLHVEGVCTLRDDGVKEIIQHLHSPIGSTFRFLADEPSGFGGGGRAPDAVSYISAGIAFCFMTQFGRYAHITRKRLDGYRIVQDTHFSARTAPGDRPGTGEAQPVDTHVFLDTPEGDDFARTALDMSERTCFLHAFCRSELTPEVRITGIS